MISKSGLLVAGAACMFLLAGPARADEAGAQRFVAALERLEDAPDPVTAIFSELHRLEGVRLTAGDAPTIRAGLGGKQSTLLPIVDVLQSLSVQSGAVTLVLTRPVLLTLKRGVLSLATEVSFRVRAGAAGELDVQAVRGIKAGRSSGLTLPLRSLSVSAENGQRVTRAVVVIAGFAKTLTLSSSPPATEGVAGVVGSSAD